MRPLAMVVLMYVVVEPPPSQSLSVRLGKPLGAAGVGAMALSAVVHEQALTDGHRLGIASHVPQGFMPLNLA